MRNLDQHTYHRDVFNSIIFIAGLLDTFLTVLPVYRGEGGSLMDLLYDNNLLNFE